MTKNFKLKEKTITEEKVIELVGSSYPECAGEAFDLLLTCRSLVTHEGRITYRPSIKHESMQGEKMNSVQKLNARMKKTIELRMLFVDALHVIESSNEIEKRGLRGFYKTLKKTYEKIVKIDDSVQRQKNKIVFK